MDDNISQPAQNPPSSQPPPLRSPAQASYVPPIYAPPKRAKGGTAWKVVAIVACVLFLCSLVVNPFHFVLGLMESGGGLPVHNTAGPKMQEMLLKDRESRNKIVVVPIEGVIMGQKMGRGFSMVDVVEEQLKRAEHDKSVKAVVLKVNSPGGEVLASDDIYKLIDEFHTRTGKPVVASMGSLAASGGYYVSAPCQWIVANELTITGSIGVIMHGYNFRGLMDKVGVRPEVFKSGKFKDMLSPDKREQDITQEERDMIQSMVNETFEKFKNVVAEGRGNAAKKNAGTGDGNRALAENWGQYADGRVLSGKEALKLGFVDELGNLDAAVARAQKLARIPDANLIEYQPLFDISDLFGMFGQSSEARTLKIDIGPDAPRLQMGRLYFLCPLVLPR